jgi:menaquinone-9 beta-reductase
MTVENSYDVLVVGARCAGAATAMLMARRGLRVLAIDRAAYGSDTISTHALMRGGVLQLSRWGLLPRLLEVDTPAVRTTSFHYGDESLSVAIQPLHGLDALYAPRRTVLDSLLVDAAWEAGAVIRHGHTLVDLLHRPDGRVCGATIADADGNLIQVNAALVVGADGLGSAVARLAGVPTIREARHTSAVVFGYFSGINLTGYHWYYRPGMSAGAIPTNAGQHCVFASIPQERFRSEPWRADKWTGFNRTLWQTDLDLAGSVSQSRCDEPLRIFAGRKGFFRQAFGPGWALVGDAGYFKDPLTAHGITDALRDAELLADAAAGGTISDFADYAAARDALSMPLFEVTDSIASFNWNLDQLQSLHQTLNRSMKQEVAHLLTLGGTHSTTSGATQTLIREDV